MVTAAALSGNETSIVVFYGGKGGKGKRIDITFSSEQPHINLNQYKGFFR